MAKQEQKRRGRGGASPKAKPQHARGAAARKRGAKLRGARAAPAPSVASNRKVDAAARREAILDAALMVFAERGYEAARLEDMAKRAGVAKGTVYLYFKDKQALFEALVRGDVSPMLGQVTEAAVVPGMKPLDVLDLFFALFQKEVLGTKRKLLLRLIISEGPRFPALAEFYYREVVSHGIKLMRAVATKAAASGEFRSDAPQRFPQLIMAPMLMAAIWDGLFSRIDPLDVRGLLRAHRELLTGSPGR